MRLATALGLVICLCCPARADDARIQFIKKEFAAIEQAAKNRKLKHARISIGGSQNPMVTDVYYLGGSEADYEKDPYAAPFRLRKVKREIVLPAVGEAGAAFYFEKNGSLFFVHVWGGYLGIPSFSLKPLDQLRVYYRGDKPIRVILTDANKSSPEHIDPLSVPAREAAGALLKQARDLAKALGVLAASD